MRDMEVRVLVPLFCGAMFTGVGKSRLTVVTMGNTEFILILLVINYCITYLYSNCKSTLLTPVGIGNPRNAPTPR